MGQLRSTCTAPTPVLPAAVAFAERAAEEVEVP
jgi:hypothetical protein